MKPGEFAVGMVLALVVVLFCYSVYYIGKTVSYKLAYEDMVQETIQLQVKKSCLNDSTR